jgi:hypothetical protein
VNKTLRDSLEREKSRKTSSQGKYEVKANVHTAQNAPSAYIEHTTPELVTSVSTYPTPKCQCEEHKVFWPSTYESHYQAATYATLGRKKSTSSSQENKQCTSSSFENKKSSSSASEHKKSAGSSTEHKKFSSSTLEHRKSSGAERKKSSNSHPEALEQKKCVKFSSETTSRGEACHTLPSRGKSAKKDTRVRISNCDNEGLVWL